MSRRCRPAFSTINLLVLLALILLLLAMLFPAIVQIRRAAARSQSLNNLRQIGIGVHNYHDVYKGMPPTVGKSNNISGTALFHILPFVEQEALYRRGLEDWTRIADETVPIYLDPEDKTAPPRNLYQEWLATTNYAANWMVFREGDMKIQNIPDGTSNTILFTQRYQLCNGEPTAWAYNRLHYRAPMFAFYSRARFQVAPDQKDCDSGLPQAVSEDGIQLIMADVSTRIIRHCSPQTWGNATNPDDGMPLGDDFN